MKRSMIILMLVAGLALAACGESAEDKAQTQVCDARANIKKTVDDLSSLTLATASVDGITSSLKSIRTDLGKIKDAQGDLAGDRKQQVSDANQAFTSQLSSIVKSVAGGGVSPAEAGTQIKAAAGQLATTYQETLGKIDCS